MPVTTIPSIESTMAQGESLMREKSRFRRFRRAVVLIFASTTVVAAATGKDRSPAFDAALTQVYEQYVLPNELTLAELEQNTPTNLAVMIGLVLQGQAAHVSRNQDYAQPFVQLQHEFIAYLDEVARRADNVDAFTGQQIDRDSLWSIVVDAINGRYDQFAITEYGRAPVPGPPVFTARGQTRQDLESESASTLGAGSTTSSEATGRLINVPEEQAEVFGTGDHISLLGVRPSESTPVRGQSTQPRMNPARAAFNRGVDAWNQCVNLWSGGAYRASGTKFESAQAHFKQACDGGWSDGCLRKHDLRWIMPSDPKDFDPKIHGPRRSYLSWSTPITKEMLRACFPHWGERKCGSGCQACY